VVSSGALMGVSMGMQIFISAYQMWFYKTDEQDKKDQE
jgi:hypothetical protein